MFDFVDFEEKRKKTMPFGKMFLSLGLIVWIVFIPVWYNAHIKEVNKPAFLKARHEEGVNVVQDFLMMIVNVWFL